MVKLGSDSLAFRGLVEVFGFAQRQPRVRLAVVGVPVVWSSVVMDSLVGRHKNKNTTQYSSMSAT